MAVSTLFDGTNDNIVSNTGNNLTLGAYTWGALLHLETIAGLDTWFSLDDGGTARYAPFTSGTTLGVEHATGTSATLANAFADWGGWRLVFITKASGTAAPRAHIFNGVAWTHTNMGTAIGNPNGSISLLWIGAYATGASDFSDGEVGWMGLWNEDTNDATCETYVNFTTLTAKSNAQFFTGTSLLNGGTMNDSGAGNNDETSRTGATTGVRDLPGWQTNFHTQAVPGVSRTSEYVGTTGQPTEARPTGATTGDLVIVVGATDTNTTIGWSSGWTELYNTANGTATRLGCAARVLTGGGDDTLAISLGGGTNTNDFAFQEHLIPAALHSVTTPATDIDVGTAATGTSATPDPPTVNVDSGDYFILTMFAADDDDTSNAYMPASYAGLRQTRSTTGTSSCMVATAFAERTSITSENPGTFTMVASEEWVAGTIAIATASAQPVTVNAQVASLVLSGVQTAPTLGAFTVTAQVGAVTLSAVTAGGTLTALTVTAQAATVAVTGLEGTPTLTALDVAAQVGTVVLTGIEGTPDNGAAPVTVNAQTAVLGLSAVSSGATLTAVTVQAQVAALALTGVQAAPTLGALSVTGQNAALILSAVTSAATLDALQVTAQTGTVVLTGVQTAPTLDPLTVTAQTGAVTLTGVPGLPVIEGEPVTVTAQTATLTVAGVSSGGTLAPLTVQAQTAVVVLAGVPGTAGAVVTVTAQTATLTVTGQSGAVTLTAASVTAQPAALTLTAQPGAVTLTPLTVQAQTAVLVLSAVASLAGAFIAVPGPRVTSRQPGRVTSTAAGRVTTRTHAPVGSAAEDRITSRQPGTILSGA